MADANEASGCIALSPPPSAPPPSSPEGSDNAALAAMGGGLGTVIAIGLLYAARQFAKSKKEIPKDAPVITSSATADVVSAEEKPGAVELKEVKAEDVKVDATIHDV